MNGEYATLLVCGLGTVGSAFVRLGESFFGDFDLVALMDRDPSALRKIEEQLSLDVVTLEGDLNHAANLRDTLRTLPSPVLLVNLTSDTDTVKVRRSIADLPVAYMDCGSSRMDKEPSRRFSRIMPYTLQALHGEHPHLLCQGINPGMVEIVARLQIEQMEGPLRCVDILVFETDSLKVSPETPFVPVGWCPEDLVEEIMISPTMEVRRGSIVEERVRGTRTEWVSWRGETFPCRVVGHEDIWNLGQLSGVGSAAYLYNLDRRVMDTFLGSSEEAAESFRVPGQEMVLDGADRICVSVGREKDEHRRAWVWEVDHAATGRAHGMNGVQFQTAASLLTSMAVLNHTHLSSLPGTFTATTLPFTPDVLETLQSAMDMLRITWQKDVESPLRNGFHPERCGRSGPEAAPCFGREIGPEKVGASR